ncbi:MAG: hypothetical protein IH822_03090 [Chloroflexi bacterium]|nr:hypothetical protein [Chloroflexota bacterium]
MATDAAVQTESKEPTQERFASGKLKGKKERENDSPAAPSTNRRSCYICNATVPGDAFTTLSDEDGVARAVHVPIHAIGSNSGAVPVDITPACLKTFESRVADANRRKAREHHEDQALAARDRQFSASAPRGYDCTVEDCERFFDSEGGRDTHLHRGHKTK